MKSNARSLCASSLDVLNLEPVSTSHRRAAGIICRQAIEAQVRVCLGQIDHDDLKWRSRFLLLREIGTDSEARLAHAVWAQLSEIRHYHHYDLVPSYDSIRALIDEALRWITIAESWQD